MGLTYHLQILPVNNTMCTVTKFHDGTFITMEVIGCQVRAIGKAVRPTFTDLVTNVDPQSHQDNE